MKFQHIISISKDEIELKVTYTSNDLWKIIESVFHAGGLHLRYIFHFQKHIFLVKVSEFVFLNYLNLSSGIVKSNLVAKSLSGAVYKGCILSDDGLVLQTEFLLGVKDYDHEFRKESLKPYYERLFRCLMNTKRK